MPRKSVPECPESFVHITNRCVNKEWFDQPLDEVWQIFCLHLEYTRMVYEFEIFAFVLMDNHYHLLARFPKMNRALAMRHFGQEVGKDLRLPASRLNRVFGSRYKPTLISRSEAHFRTVYKYIYANPLKAKKCLRAEDYSYSTLNGLLGKNRLLLSLNDDWVLFQQDFTHCLDWINDLPTDHVWDQIRLNMQKTVFKLPKVTSRGRRTPVAL